MGSFRGGFIILLASPFLFATGIAQESGQDWAEQVRIYLEGTDKEAGQARMKIRKAGADAMPHLVAARVKYKGSGRYKELLELIYVMKCNLYEHKTKKAVMKRFDALRKNFDFPDAPVSEVLKEIEKGLGCKVMLDPQASHKASEAIKFSGQGASVRMVMEAVFEQAGLDYDARYGGVFVSVPERLWKMPGSGVEPVPIQNAWRRQKLEFEETLVAKRLLNERVTVIFDDRPISAATAIEKIAFLGLLRLKMQSSRAKDVKVQFRTANEIVNDLIEMLTLQHGIDAKIEGRHFVVYDR